MNSFDSLELPPNCETIVYANILTVTKWDWDYAECLDFQKKAQAFIRENRSLKIYIFCNHPHVFTLGTGNERGQKDLVEFQPEDEKKLSFPLFKIRRGGGVTFHYPGQWIFYPIVALSPKNNLEELMCWMLKEVASILRESFNVENVLAAKKLMGVWVDRRKIASIGLGVNRFVTEHGLALNLQKDELMSRELRKISPCGLNFSTYLSLEELNSKNDNLQKFHELFYGRLFS